MVLLVVLRISIGWQFLYEGLWKIDTLDSPRPWTSAGYLKNSQGPLRGVFREMAGDPNEMGLLDYDAVAASWDDWSARFQSHYSLDEKQAEKLRAMMNGSHSMLKGRKVYAEALNKLPSGVEKLNVSSKVIWFDVKAKRLYVDADQHLLPEELAKLEALVKGRTDDEATKFKTAVNRLFDRQKKGIGFKEKLLGMLKGNPDLVGNQDWQRVGRKDEYQNLLSKYESNRTKADVQFKWDHLDHNWGEIQALRAELTAPVKSLAAELKEKADAILTLEQLSRGPVPEPWTALRFADTMTIIGLTVLGTLLILGLGTRVAAIAGAFMLFNFYMAMPPWPGVPEAPGPEHSFIINKNLIEVIALLAIAVLPTGHWFGLDGIIRRLCPSCCGGEKTCEPQATTPQPTQEPAASEAPTKA